MNATEPGPSDDGPDLTAAEYVLGVLDRSARAAADRRIGQEPGFAAEVAAWEARLTPLVQAIPPVEPPARLWPAIAARLKGAPGEVVELRPRRGWDSVGLWRGVAAGATALAAACVLILVVPRRTPPAPAEAFAVARLEAPGGGAAFVATLDETRRRLIVTPVGGPAPAGRSPELWLMPANAKPSPLGVFAGQASLVAQVPASVAGGALLGVSLEPLGGSPTGLPTGPVIAQGRLSRL